MRKSITADSGLRTYSFLFMIMVMMLVLVLMLVTVDFPSDRPRIFLWTKKNIAFQVCVCYNASRLKDRSYPCRIANGNPGAATPGFFIPFLVWWLRPYLGCLAAKHQPDYFLSLMKSMQSSSRYAFSKASFGDQDTYPSGYTTLYPAFPSFSCGSAFTIFTPI